MLFNLIGTFVVGIAAAGTILLIYRLSGRRAPRWLMPAAAGVAMLSFHLWNEYTWFDRTSKALPEQVTVAERYAYQSVLQPWTLVAPRINRFTAVDRSSIRRNEQAPGYVMAEVFLVTRLDRTAKITQIYNCSEALRTDVGASSNVDERGLPVDADWIASETDDALFQLVCGPP